MSETFMGLPLVYVSRFDGVPELNPNMVYCFCDPTDDEKRQMQQWADNYVGNHPKRQEFEDALNPP